MCPLGNCAEERRRPGKVHRSLLPPQGDLIRFVAGITNQDCSWGTHCGSDFKFSKWAGVICKGATIKELWWAGRELSGAPDWLHLPDSLTVVMLQSNHLTGEIDLSRLPYGLQILNLEKNGLSGSIDLQRLPTDLKELLLGKNFFSGPADFSMLPVGLKCLSLAHNTLLSGTVTKGELPAQLQNIIQSVGEFIPW
eukprot:CAMPEP_0201481402 /NCGR_PEP_ID=MMETSP0151_2-20130828/5673_1 /ASSEMBLY_ACC=CAM_ASM_000257 /TAXON_ID=200890 /ORGANISM="Paramoeba atlantica, Strain 621/1 / CCAP 1560/9" /LENGTH=194 /DNA_ID=CAMNT_0047863579 /DNA_START=61 /DNA_END=642 /DNA_ORIENTATION=-